MTVKDISIKNQTYYFFNDIINIKDFDLDNIQIVEKSYKSDLLYWTCNNQKLQLNYSFKFESNVCNRCHDLLMSVNLSDIAN